MQRSYSSTMNPEIRIVLVGKTGVGKSATGNTILGEKAFNSEARATSITKECSFAAQMINRRQVSIVDTPGLYDTHLSNEQVINEVVNCIRLAAPGPHVFLLIIAIGRFTEEERNTIQLIQKVFGQQVHRHMMVLFTRADDLEDRTLEDFIEEAPELKEVIEACSGRFHMMNNREKRDRSQVDELITKIVVMIKQNQHSYYNYHMFEMASELNNARKTAKEKEQIIDDLKKELRKIQKDTDKSFCCIL